VERNVAAQGAFEQLDILDLGEVSTGM